MTARQIADLVQGDLIGRASVDLVSAAPVSSALPNQLSFWQRGHANDRLPETRAGCVIVDEQTQAPGITLIRVQDPRRAFAKALRAIAPSEAAEWSAAPSADVAGSAELGPGVEVGAHAVIAAGAAVGEGTLVGPNAFIGQGAVVGRHCTLHPGAKVYGNARLGDRVVLHAGAVIGSQGFGLVFADDHYERFPQIGGVRIGNDVEIGANACVDRGTLGNTVVGTGSKLDNLVHIGHNCQIGSHVVMAAQVGLSGGVVVDDYAVLGGQAGIGEKARIGARAQVGGQTGLLPGKRLEAGGSYWGTPARPLREQLGRQARVSRLPRIFAEIRRLRARIGELEGH